MLDIKEHFPLRPKTTMRIGGTARYFAELKTREEVEEAITFACGHNLPLIPLGSGSNTIFAEPEINALVVQIKHESVRIDSQRITVGAGKNLPMMINELAAQGLDLSALTGIPGTVGGAIFGNAGQGPTGIWIDQFVESVTTYVDGAWKTFSKADCRFRYRESAFKDLLTRTSNLEPRTSPVIWEATLIIPSAPAATIKTTIESLLKRRIETQPHQRTAGSCFKAIGGIPAWQLIDAANLRGLKVGGVEISTKHANFLLSSAGATYADTVAVVDKVKSAIPQNLHVEMRFFEPDGSILY